MRFQCNQIILMNFVDYTELQHYFGSRLIQQKNTTAEHWTDKFNTNKPANWNTSSSIYKWVFNLHINLANFYNKLKSAQLHSVWIWQYLLRSATLFISVFHLKISCLRSDPFSCEFSCIPSFILFLHSSLLNISLRFFNSK